MATAKQDLASRPNKPRWADLEDADEEEDNANGGGGGDLNFLLPPTKVIGPDKKGIKKVIEYKFNEAGKIVKVTTTSRVLKIVTREKKRVLERRSWPKFGDAVNEDVGARLTVASTEEISLERPKALGSTTKERLTGGEEPLGQLGNNKGAVLMLCRSCGKKGDHWTARCPYKDLITTTTQAEALNYLKDPNAAQASCGISNKSGGSYYIPPSKRLGADNKKMISSSGSSTDNNNNKGHNNNNENSVKVSNLSEEAQEEDLRELFGTFGPLTRVYVASDRQTGFKRGFGFVNFVHMEDAERAIMKLNGYGYDNLILEVEWAPARSK